MFRRNRKDERDGESSYLRAPAFKSLGSQREGRHRQTLGLSSQKSGHLDGHISRKFYAGQTSPKGSGDMQYGSGNLNLPTVECQLASKYVTSRPIDLPTVPAKTELDDETNRILEDMALEVRRSSRERARTTATRRDVARREERSKASK